ncbi:hypothetical protein D9758_014648 [Tetrapyrgos nigripes]|uniref:DUF6534 domain-containing protein n=1 Tax=Tetrapyrgos nigripes TaxID=182062 RepID=A0A8H5CW78_9AGAR|nr:hypothetical protein D9758_014648 [Tetrapyrgos nigripes]
MSSLDLTLGPLVVCFTISTLLYGVATVQTYWYFKQFSGEHKLLNAAIMFIWLNELAHQVCISCTIYQLTVANFGNPKFLEIIPLPLILSVFFLALGAGTAQSILIYRLWKINKKLVITAVIVALAILRLIATFVAGIKLSFTPNLQQFIGKNRWLLIMLWVTVAVLDTSVTTCVIHSLIKRRQNAIKRTTELVDKIIFWTVETSLITSTVAITTVIVFAAAPDTAIWLGLFLILPRLYSNSILASLNQRGVLREQSKNGVINLSYPNSNSAPRMAIPDLSGTGTVNPGSDFHLSSSRSRSMQISSNCTQPVIAIEMSAITEVDHDVDEGRAYK